MGWFGKLAFGSVGLFLGGPIGAIAGAALGHLLVDKREDFQVGGAPRIEGSSLGGVEQAQAAYFISLFSILGKLSKIDGVVSREEIVVVENFINNLPLADREKQFARQVFNEAKNSSYAIEDFSIQFYGMIKQQPAVLLSFFDLLFQVVAADGTFHPAEEAALKRIKDIFRINDQQFDNIKGVYFKEVNKYYKMLNCTPQCSDQEIKSNYKKLVKEFHPDTIVSKGLPEEFTDFATKRFREIQEAYENVKRERNL
ncbi:TerB family tellurite resistance protein [bacterium]|nr:TerB family tellurite resistance protein [bacterium]